MRKPKYDPEGFVSRLQSLAKYSVLYAEHQSETFENSVKNSTKRLVEAYQDQNEYIEYLENKTSPKHTREELEEMLEEFGNRAINYERYHDEKEYEEQKEKILDIFDKLIKG